MRSIRHEKNLKDKKILLRLDLNVPLKNGRITDSLRIDKILPTLNFLIEKKTKIIILSHVGRPKGKVVKELSLKPISKYLKDKLNINVKLVQENIKNIKNKDFFKKFDEKILNLIDKKTKVILSIFAGRMADAGIDPVPEFKKSIRLAQKLKNVEILWASVREPYNYLQAKQLGCHIITVPPLIIEKIEKFGKSMNQLTIETVNAFLKDSKKSKFNI